MLSVHARKDGKHGQSPAQIYTDLQEGEGWHRANIAESLASSPKLVLPKAQARGGKEKQKPQLGQYYGSTTVLGGGAWFGSS